MLAFLVAALSVPVVAFTGACAGPTIAEAGIQSTHTDGDVRHYDLAITVVNQGSRPIPASVLESVVIYQNGDKVDQKGVPSLRAGQRATVIYRFQRSAEARDNTTHFRLQLVQHDPHGTAVTNCGSTSAYRFDV